MWLCCCAGSRSVSTSPLHFLPAGGFSVTNYDAGDVLTVYGGAPLNGELRVRGAKNLVSKAMVAAVLGETPSRLFDVPAIRDVEVVTGLLALHGVKVTRGALDG